MPQAYTKTGVKVKNLADKYQCILSKLIHAMYLPLIYGLLFLSSCCITVCMDTESATTSFDIDKDALIASIVELNSMSPADGIIMTRGGKVRTGYTTDEDFLCMLIPAGKLARQLTGDGLSSYTGKELVKWAGEYDIEPLQRIVAEAIAK
jgi:hypothetical protein